jgi:zinc and cadmium transporter
MEQLILLSLIGGLLSLLGGVTLLWNPGLTRKFMLTLISFGAGAFLAAAFLDILPEAIELAQEPHSVFMAVLAGFVLFFSAERLAMKYLGDKREKHTHDEHTESLPLLLILGDSLHNFLDGILIAIAFAANPTIGLSATLAIAAHEIPQEIGDFSVLLHLGWKRGKIIAINVLQSLLTIPGVLVGFYLGGALEPQLPLLLGGTAGIFLYIAASDLIPALHHASGHKYAFRVIIPMITSILFIYYLIQLTHLR